MATFRRARVVAAAGARGVAQADADDAPDGFMDLAEMLLFFEFMMGGRRPAGATGKRGGDGGGVDVDVMFDFAFGAAPKTARGGGAPSGAPAHWGAMDDGDTSPDDEGFSDDESDDASRSARGSGTQTVLQGAVSFCARRRAGVLLNISGAIRRPTTSGYPRRSDRGDGAAPPRSAAAPPSVQPLGGRDACGRLGVGELKALLRERAVDFSGSVDRADILPVGPDFATYLKKTTQAVHRCKNEQRRCSYGRALSAYAGASRSRSS